MTKVLKEESNAAQEFGITPDSAVDDFFQQLEDSVEPTLRDEPKITEAPVDNPTNSGVAASSEEATLLKRYEDSSKEGKRLYEENQRLQKQIEANKDLQPIIEDMKSNPEMLSHIKNFYERGTETKSILEEVGVPETFIGDFDEAISNPESDSGRVLANVVDKMVQQRIRESTMKSNEERQAEMARQNFQQEKKLSDEDMEKMKNWASDYRPSMDDLYMLYQKQSGTYDANVERDVKKDVMERMSATQQMPNNVSGGSVTTTIAPEQAMMDAIIQQADGGFEIFD